ncbi:MAG TPA: hypothetical protein VH062_24925 [Polyangiaceae bacterium]|nr:hypothetical protein [Polyangiaceae bacterium]
MEFRSFAVRVLSLLLPALGLAPSCVHDSRNVNQATVLPERHPAPIAVRTYPLCTLVGPRNADPGVYGTDLGITVKLPDEPGRVSDRLAVFFGDTWAKAGDACKYPVAHSDDLQAWLPAYRPTTLRIGAPTGNEKAACKTLEYPLEDRKDVTSWSRVRLCESVDAKKSDAPSDTGMLRAPNGAFSDGKTVYVMYGADPVPCDATKECPESMLCSTDPTYSGKKLGECSGAFAKAGNAMTAYCRDGKDCPATASCDMTPKHGVCLTTTPFTVHTDEGAVAPRWFEDDPRRGVARMRSIAGGVWQDRPSDYGIVVRFPTNKFQNVSVRTVAFFDPEDPGKNDYRPGNHTLLMWGRATYAEKHGAQTLPFLLYQSLAGWKDGQRKWSPRFFAGYRKDGRPAWSERESDAQPIYGTQPSLLKASSTHLEWTEPEFDYVNQMTLSYVEPLKRWVMLYGGDDPAFIVLDPGSTTVPDPVHLQRSPGAIHFRIARHPWGRALHDSPAGDGFTSAEPILTRKEAAPYLACGDGGEKELPGCLKQGDPNSPLSLFGTLASLSTKLNVGGFADITASCLGGAVAMAGQNALSGNPIGRLYGANVIDEWTAEVKDGTAPGERAAEIYWNASTWNPYQVVLFKTELRVTDPDEPASSAPVPKQIP